MGSITIQCTPRPQKQALITIEPVLRLSEFKPQDLLKLNEYLPDEDAGVEELVKSGNPLVEGTGSFNSSEITWSWQGTYLYTGFDDYESIVLR